ncbi:MAG: DUF3570 domain-containing protein [Alphaproteobacteria bacterium]|jgi:hypothetical protein|nr:DUF3570 domain-containing protein [Alphaproteobacteria bacterium]
MMNMIKSTPAFAVHSLMLAALNLPGIQSALAESRTTKPQTDFLYTRTDEGARRYQIDSYLANLKMPLGEKFDIDFTAIHEAMSGATTVLYLTKGYNEGSLDNKTLVESRTNDTIYDSRREVSIKPRYFGENYNVGLVGIISEENDYESKTVGINYGLDFNNNNTELRFGYLFSDDAIKASQSANARRLVRIRERKAAIKNDFSIGIKQDLSTTSLVNGMIEFIADKGFLSDPYKAVLIWGDARPKRSSAYFFNLLGGAVNPTNLSNATLDNDRRPDYKGTLAASVQFIQKITPLDSSVHLGYRFVKNTWDIKSHTINLDYYQQVSNTFEVVPSVRYYTQNEAYFYAMAFDIVGGAPFPAKRIYGNEPASSDYRLGKYGSITGEIKFNFKFMEDNSGKFTFAMGHIYRRNTLAWGSKLLPRNPTNDFKTYYFSAGLKFVF